MLASRVLVRLRPLVTYQESIRMISFDKLTNKRITRLESDIELEDCEFKSRLINRNPRNLEQMSYECKPKGFWLDESPPCDWNMLIFEQSGGHLHAYLKHWSGKKIIEASTKEPQLSKYLKSTNTIQAATILGQILSRRCLQSGYLYAGMETLSSDSRGVKTKAFCDAVQANGFELKEPPEILPRSATDL